AVFITTAPVKVPPIGAAWSGNAAMSAATAKAANSRRRSTVKQVAGNTQSPVLNRQSSVLFPLMLSAFRWCDKARFLTPSRAAAILVGNDLGDEPEGVGVAPP
ncbi:MAG: hypothetical protein LC793_17805, partial [Thermomicrobia bacterium]|nr:hypothetical protein [Thermomicrobia bacterium]